ncbi:hypothetical protein CLOM_g24599 [Closterium sp. NIES-68]|nr:hypothetical protein CLOM_g24599 [Closterium sp. NIES-68]
MARESLFIVTVNAPAFAFLIAFATLCWLSTAAGNLTASNAPLSGHQQLTVKQWRDAWSGSWELIDGGRLSSSEGDWSDTDARSQELTEVGGEGSGRVSLLLGGRSLLSNVIVSRGQMGKPGKLAKSPAAVSRKQDRKGKSKRPGTPSRAKGGKFGKQIDKGKKAQRGTTRRRSSNGRIKGRASAMVATPPSSTSSSPAPGGKSPSSASPSTGKKSPPPSKTGSSLFPPSSPSSSASPPKTSSPSAFSSSSPSPRKPSQSQSPSAPSSRAAPAAWGASRMQLVTVPSARAMCLDGSPAGYYFRTGTGTGAKKWLIYFHGGGWCTTAADCQQRAKSFRGSSRFWPKPTDGNFTKMMNEYHTQFTGILSADAKVNPEFGNWNMAVLMYCDGGAYMGYKGRAAVGSSRVFYSGRRIVMLLLEDMLKNRGLSVASAALITGCSAGGQGVAVSCDWMASRLPSSATVKCAIDAGYFLDEPDLVGRFSFRGMMQRMMRSQWSDAAFNPLCVQAYPRAEKWRCLFPANALLHTTTPVLVLNSAFDLAALAIGLSRGNVEAAMTGSYESVVPCFHSDRFLACPRGIRKYVGHHAIVLRNSIQALTQDRQAAGVQFRGVVPNKTSHCTMAYNDWSVPDANGVRLRDVVAAWFLDKQL